MPDQQHTITTVSEGIFLSGSKAMKCLLPTKNCKSTDIIHAMISFLNHMCYFLMTYIHISPMFVYCFVVCSIITLYLLTKCPALPFPSFIH